jgi:hypothetical protein
MMGMCASIKRDKIPLWKNVFFADRAPSIIIMASQFAPSANRIFTKLRHRQIEGNHSKTRQRVQKHRFKGTLGVTFIVAFSVSIERSGIVASFLERDAIPSLSPAVTTRELKAKLPRPSSNYTTCGFASKLVTSGIVVIALTAESAHPPPFR